MQRPVTKALARAAGPVGIIGAAGGFISDVFLPLANFAPIVFGLSILATVASYAILFVIFKRRGEEQALDSFALGMLVASFGSAMVFGVWSIVLVVAPERGYLATNIDSIADLQGRLLNIEQGVQEIKETSSETATQVAQSATAQAEGFANLEEALKAIQSGQQVIIANPATPQEWYNNARVFQLRGDTGNAIQAYKGYFGSAPNLEFVDPFEDYAGLLKATEGIARTREAIQDLANQSPQNRALEMVLATMLDTRQERIDRLRSLTERHPQFGPGFYALGQEYNGALLETLTKDLLDKQRAAYENLFDLEKAQQFSVFYIDKLVAQERLEEAQAQIDAWARAEETFGNVGVEVYTRAEGVQFIVIFPEVDGQDLLYSIDDPNPSASSGKNTVGGQSYINTSIGPLPVPVGEHVFYFKYIDKNGVASEVFEHPFEVPGVIVIWTQNPPDFSTNVISGQFVFQVPYVDTSTAYLFRYSLDDASLDQQISSISVASLEIPEIAPGEHILYVQAEQVGGQATEVVEFAFTVE